MASLINQGLTPVQDSIRFSKGAILTANEIHPQSTPQLACRRRTLRVAFAACCAFYAIAPMARAQNPAPAANSTQRASLHGVVTNADGTVYEGARVDLELRCTGEPVVATQRTDSGGAFNFANLPAGQFKLVISSAGFASQAIGGTLHDGEAYDTHSIVLPLEGAASTVRVSAESQAEIAVEQVRMEEKQRVLGVIPNYFVSYDPHPVPLSKRQKYELAWKTTIDPVTWAMNGWVAGMEQASNTFRGYGQGAEGYAKRFGANTADTAINTMLTGAILPSIFHQDPRYMYKGKGSISTRALYAMANAVICKGDNGHWQPQYSGILGGLASGAISNLYYPHSDRSDLDTMFFNAAIGTGEGAMQNLFQEFVVRHFTPHLPHYNKSGQ